jgi:serine/threonine protein kinase
MPSRIGPYEIKGELGRGAMAVVWRAWDPVLQREVAIKEPVRSPGMSDWLANELESRFILEGHAAARLNHPNIITVYAADTFEGRPAIVMEVLEGSTLSELIDRKQLTPERIESIWSQLLDALIYAHSMGVVHRDVKPDNIFVSSNNLVKLTDFGVAHLASSAASLQDGIIAGSPGYMAPEQAAGELADARSDLFSFSVIAYEMLALRNPFGATEGLAREELLLRTQASETLAAFEALPEISAVIAKGLRYHPKDRWQTGKHYKSALTKALNGERYIFMSQRKGRAVPYQKENESGASPELFTLKPPAKENKNTLIMVIFALVALLLVVGVASGAGFIIILGFIALLIAGAVFVVNNHKDKLEEGFEKVASAAKAQPSSSASFSSFEEMLPSSTKQISIRIISPSGITTDEVIETPLVIGRDRMLGNHHLRDERVSANHLSLEFDGTQVLISDVGSRNGTIVDNRPLTGTQPLFEGSKIQIGDTIIRVLQL